MSINQSLIIKCPRCGKQYYFQEIFHPKTIFNSVYNIIRDEQENIEDLIEDTTDMSELYFCDKCSAPLNIKASLIFQVSIDHKLDFTKDTIIIKND